MGKTILRIVFLASLALNLAFAAYLISTCCHGNSRFAGPDPQLSRQQIRDMKEVRRQLAPRYETLRRKRDQFQEKLVALLKTEPADLKRINSCIENISAAQQEIQKLNVEEILACKRFLSNRQCCCLLDRGANQAKMSCGADNGCPADSK